MPKEGVCTQKVVVESSRLKKRRRGRVGLVRRVYDAMLWEHPWQSLNGFGKTMLECTDHHCARQNRTCLNLPALYPDLSGLLTCLHHGSLLTVTGCIITSRPVDIMKVLLLCDVTLMKANFEVYLRGLFSVAT